MRARGQVADELAVERDAFVGGIQRHRPDVAGQELAERARSATADRPAARRRASRCRPAVTSSWTMLPARFAGTSTGTSSTMSLPSHVHQRTCDDVALRRDELAGRDLDLLDLAEVRLELEVDLDVDALDRRPARTG